MPFCVVLTIENSKKLISLVPSCWVSDNILLWPNTRKTSEIDRMRREQRTPALDWKKIKCAVKANNIETFAEGTKIESLYASFNDTDDEERYNESHKIHRLHPTLKSITEDLLDFNSDFETNEANNDLENDISNKVIANNDNAELVEVPSVHITENCEMDPQHQNVITMNLSELNNIISENSRLAKENEQLKESMQRFQSKVEEQIQRGFSVIKVQLDKIFELMRNDNVPVTSNSLENEEEEIAKKFKFPLKSLAELDLLENELNFDSALEKVLIKYFSKSCGTSGKQKLAKIGLPLVKSMVTDELLNKVTWKGIKGCTKVPLSRFIQIRDLFYKTVRLADNNCSAKDADAFLQNSAIKHSGQRLKRKSCAVENTIPKKKKDEEKENETVENTPESRKVTVLADVKITDKTKDLKNKTKMANISSDNLQNSQLFKQIDMHSNSSDTE